MDSGLLADLKRIVPEQNLSTGEDDLDRYSGDALGAFRAFWSADRLSARPGVIVWATSAREVSAVLKLAQSHQVPVVPYGSGTGVMGAASALEDCIILNVQRMNAVLSVSKQDMTATLQPGVVLENAARALKEHGLLLGHDPWSRPIASVGGAISTNGVGYLAARYGPMGEQVVGLEAVMADGEIVRTRPVPSPSFGKLIDHLLIGAEGTFGVITEATIRAFPQPEKRTLRCVEFPDFEHGFHAITRLYAEGVRPSMVDYGEEVWDSGGQESRESTLYLAFEGFAEDVDAHDRRALEVCARFDGVQGDQDEVERFWRTRHTSGERYRKEVLESSDPRKARRRRSSYRMDYLHVALPVSRVLEYRRRCQEILGQSHVVVREWSIWGRPEFFSFLIVEENDAGGETSPEMGKTVDRVLTLAQEMGGSMEYCHGVGIKLAHLLGGELGTGMGIVKRMKAAIDQNNILNPGKLVP